MTIGAEVDVNPGKRSNSLIGEEVHTLMWRSGRTQKQLGQLLGVDQGSISKRLKGKTEWAAWEVAATAAWLNVPITDLIPEMEISPDGGDDGGAAGAPSRARTYDLRIISPPDSPSTSVELDQATAA